MNGAVIEENERGNANVKSKEVEIKIENEEIKKRVKMCLKNQICNLKTDCKKHKIKSRGIQTKTCNKTTKCPCFFLVFKMLAIQ